MFFLRDTNASVTKWRNASLLTLTFGNGTWVEFEGKNNRYPRIVITRVSKVWLPMTALYQGSTVCLFFYNHTNFSDNSFNYQAFYGMALKLQISEKLTR